jgi:hypothetical protein
MPANRDHYIQVDKDLMDDPLLLEAATRLYTDESQTLCWAGGDELSEEEGMQLSRARYVSALIRLWCYADTYIDEDDTLPMSEIPLDQYVGLKGFCKISPPEWLVITDTGRIKLPGYCEKNNVVGRRIRKAERAEYMRNWRNQSRDSHVAGDEQSRKAHVPLNTNTSKSKEKNSLRSFQKKATRLPKDWKPDAELRAFAEREGLTNVDTIADMFRDWWTSAPGAKGTKLDWGATWRVWCRKEADRLRQNAQRTAMPRAWTPRPTQESALAAIEAAARLTADAADPEPDDGYIRMG